MALTKKSEKSSNRNTCEYVHFGMYHLRDRPYTNTLQILFSKSGIYVKEQIRGEGGRREIRGGRKENYSMYKEYEEETNKKK